MEGKSYKLQFPWIGVVNRSQADINKSVDMIAARRKEREYFANSPEYKHLAHRMGSEHLGKVLSKVSKFSTIDLVGKKTLCRLFIIVMLCAKLLCYNLCLLTCF